MFSGIIEAIATTSKVSEGNQSLQIEIARPTDFDDLHIGDSICCNGICLTIEEFDPKRMVFSLGFETLKITGWQPGDLKVMEWNLERSLKFGDRIHGHLVSGHVDAMGKVVLSEARGDSWLLSVEVPESLQKYVWQKSCLTINGVSLTVNRFEDGIAEICLVPETLRKTNLQSVAVGDLVTLETDYYMKGMLAHAQSSRAH